MTVTKAELSRKLSELRIRLRFQLDQLQLELILWRDIKTSLVKVGLSTNPVISAPLNSTVLDVSTEVQILRDKLALIRNIADFLGLCEDCFGTKISGLSPDRENGGTRQVPCPKCCGHDAGVRTAVQPAVVQAS